MFCLVFGLESGDWTVLCSIFIFLERSMLVTIIGPMLGLAASEGLLAEL